jgi:hypothetical protein
LVDRVRGGDEADEEGGEDELAHFLGDEGAGDLL